MQLFKFTLSFLAIGGASYALIKLNEAPAWLIAATLAMAGAALITSLPELPRAIAAVQQTMKTLTESRPTLSTLRQYSEPVSATKPPPSSTELWVQRRDEPVRRAPQEQKCAALVMSALGGWGGSAGSDLPCSGRLSRAQETCRRQVGVCGNYAVGRWVAGIHCRIRTPNSIRRNSFAGYGNTEANAFARAYQHSSTHGFHPAVCKRTVSLSAEGGAPRRYN